MMRLVSAVARRSSDELGFGSDPAAARARRLSAGSLTSPMAISAAWCTTSGSGLQMVSKNPLSIVSIGPCALTGEQAARGPDHGPLPSQW